MRHFVHLLYMRSGWGLTLLRLVAGSIICYAGYRKVFARGFGIAYFEQHGFPLPEVVGPVISFLELGGGFMLIIGLFARYLGVLFTLEFLVATLVIALQRGVVTARLEFMLLTVVMVIATQGAGRLGVDRPGRPWEPVTNRRRN